VYVVEHDIDNVTHTREKKINPFSIKHFIFSLYKFFPALGIQKLQGLSSLKPEKMQDL
jgi:hypothetical protein